jgi:hypothetical protein
MAALVVPAVYTQYQEQQHAMQVVVVDPLVLAQVAVVEVLAV